jgi:catechol 2,3-dioxygenase-like lactoylglutathione lyase family enzyme
MMPWRAGQLKSQDESVEDYSKENASMIPQIAQIDHCSVLITDVERSRRFYRDVLGLKEIAKPRTFDFTVVWFDLGNQHLHLLLKDRPDAISPRHFALRVADAPAARAHFRAHGIATQETTPIPGADRFFLQDPDGNRIEIIQWLRPYDPQVDGVQE